MRPTRHRVGERASWSWPVTAGQPPAVNLTRSTNDLRISFADGKSLQPCSLIILADVSIIQPQFFHRLAGSGVSTIICGCLVRALFSFPFKQYCLCVMVSSKLYGARAARLRVGLVWN